MNSGMDGGLNMACCRDDDPASAPAQVEQVPLPQLAALPPLAESAAEPNAAPKLAAGTARLRALPPPVGVDLYTLHEAFLI